MLGCLLVLTDLRQASCHSGAVVVMSRGGRLRWLWRALGRARDMYVRGLTGCARYMPSDTAFGYPVFVPAAAPLSRSRSAGGYEAGDEDLRELVRAASQRRVEQRRAELRAVARSQSMAAALSMARIDEDAPCEFGADDAVRVGGPAVRRARSVAVGSAGLATRAGAGAGGGYGAAKKQLAAGVPRG